MSFVTRPRRAGRVLRFAAIAAVSLFAAAPAGAAVVDLAPSADTYVRFGTNQGNNYGSETFLDLYQYTDIRANFGYVRFDLSALPAGATIDGATLTFTKGTGGTRSDGMVNGRFATYGLLDVAGNTPQDWAETGLTFDTIGAEYVANNDTQFDTTTRTISFDEVGETVNGVTASITGDGSSSLASFLQSRLDAGGLTTFLVDTPTSDTGRGYALVSREGGAGAPVLSISYTAGAVPEPASLATLGLAGLAAVGRRRRR